MKVKDLMGGEDALFEMANYRPEETGLPWAIYLSHCGRDAERIQHGPRVKVYTEKYDGNSFEVMGGGVPARGGRGSGARHGAQAAAGVHLGAAQPGRAAGLLGRQRHEYAGAGAGAGAAAPVRREAATG